MNKVFIQFIECIAYQRLGGGVHWALELCSAIVQSDRM